jgi:hypothetical protein
MTTRVQRLHFDPGIRQLQARLSIGADECFGELGGDERLQVGQRLADADEEDG